MTIPQKNINQHNFFNIDDNKTFLEHQILFL